VPVNKVLVTDDGGVERYVRPIDAKEIVAAGGKRDVESLKKEAKSVQERDTIIEGVATGRADSIPHTPVSPDSARESIDYDTEKDVKAEERVEAKSAKSEDAKSTKKSARRGSR
jgi:hypothetical protein